MNFDVSPYLTDYPLSFPHSRYINTNHPSRLYVLRLPRVMAAGLKHLPVVLRSPINPSSRPYVLTRGLRPGLIPGPISWYFASRAPLGMGMGVCCDCCNRASRLQKKQCLLDFAVASSQLASCCFDCLFYAGYK